MPLRHPSRLTLACAAAWLIGPGTARSESWPDVSVPIRTGVRTPEDAAVVIGNRVYGQLPDAPYADRDADAFAAWALNTRGIPVQNVHRVRNGTRRAMERALEDASDDVGETGTLWVFYSGQGVASPVSGTRVLLGADAPTDLDHVDRYGLQVQALEAHMAASPAAHALLIADVSFVGAGRDGSPITPDTRFLVPALPQSGDPRVSVWLAADTHQLATAFESPRQGAFTWTVLGALRGWADRDGDGGVTLSEATRYVAATLPSLQRPDQQPVARVHPSELGTVLTRGRLEGAPDLAALEAPEAAPDLPDALAESEELEARRLAALEREMEDSVREQFQAHADAAWADALSRYVLGTPDGDQPIRRFIERFRAKRFALGHGDVVVSAAQIPDALALLRGRSSPWHAAFRMVRVEAAAVPSEVSLARRDQIWPPLLEGQTVGAAFEISDVEIPQRLYADLMGSNPSLDRRRDKPVTSVSFIDAVLFCNALSRADGLEQVYDLANRNIRWDPTADGYRLPTVAEWTLAAAGPLGTFAGGVEDKAVCRDANLADSSWADSNESRTSALSCRDGHASLAPVRTLGSNPLELFDLSGNVAEWTWDAWSDRDDDPLLVRVRQKRTLVGGSFDANPDEARLGVVQPADRGTTRADLGFRVVRSVE